MARVSQWLTNRGSFVDWTTARKSEADQPVRLEAQHSIAQHPLSLGRGPDLVGWLPIGGELPPISYFSGRDPAAEVLLDLLVDESGLPITDEDFSDPILLG